MSEESEEDSIPTISQGTEDYCAYSKIDWGRWMDKSNNNGGNSARIDSNEGDKVDAYSSPSHIASINPKTSTSTVSTSSSGSKYYNCEYKKRKYQKFRREQYSIMDAIIGEKKKSKENFNVKLERVHMDEQSTMTQHYLPRSKMKSPSSSIKNQVVHLTKPDIPHKLNSSPYQSEDDHELSASDVCWRKKDFERDVKMHEKKCNTSVKSSKSSSQLRKVYGAFDNLSKAEQKSFCYDCDNHKPNCHDLVIGPFSRDSFMRYFHEEGKKNADLLTAKKVFFNSYDNYREIKEYEITNRLVIPKGKEKPPRCVMQGSYGFCVNWFHYQINDGFIEKKIDNKNKFTYNVKDFERF